MTECWVTGAQGRPSGTRADSQTRHLTVQSWGSVDIAAGVGVGVTGVDTEAACWSVDTDQVGERRGRASAGEDSDILGNHRGTEGAIPGSLAPFYLGFSVIQLTGIITCNDFFRQFAELNA